MSVRANGYQMQFSSNIVNFADVESETTDVILVFEDYIAY